MFLLHYYLKGGFNSEVQLIFIELEGSAGVRFKLSNPTKDERANEENGLIQYPVLKVNFKQPVEFYDLIGNKRTTKSDENGTTHIPLTPAPLLIKADNLELLILELLITAL